MWKNLHVLNLSHNKLGVASGHGLSKLLRLCRGLQELYIGSCGLSSEVLEAETGFSEALKCKFIIHNGTPLFQPPEMRILLYTVVSLY